MSVTLQAPKGTRDFYPENMREQNFIFDAWKKVCVAFGFEEYEGPIFESLELFTEKSGSEIVTQLYNFKDKGEREIALRPEMTPTLARMVNQKGNSLRLPLKWFSIPRLYRYEKAQRGRLREFFQLNMDILGCDSVWAEVDLISAIIQMLKGFGLNAQDFSVRISSRQLLSDFLDIIQVPIDKKNSVYSALDKKAKLSAEGFVDLLLKENLNTEQIAKIEEFFACASLHELVEKIGREGLEPKTAEGSEASSGLADLEKLFARLVELGYTDYVALDLSVVRGLAYYTGIVFEVYDKAKSLRAIAGGGRYDNLLENLGGRPLSGVGFGMGDVVIYELLKEKNLLPVSREEIDYYLITFGELDAGLLQLAQTLRDKGRKVGYSLGGGKFKKQLAQADEGNAQKVIFYGSDKAPAGSFEIKNLRSGEQSIVALADL